jgi:hypothetical protein
MRALLATLFLALCIPALAHGPAQWIQDQNLKNGLGELCCGESDCGYMVSGTVTAIEGGYRVDAVFRIDPPNREPIMQEVHEVVPYNQASISPTGEYWRCQWGGGRKCFFAPNSGS